MQKNKTVLVVEDEQALLTAVKDKLQTEGYAVLTAKSVDTAIKQLDEKKIDVVWLDHYLVGAKKGMDLVHYMKNENSTLKSIPIFLVSNTASQDKIHSYMEIGVNKYYTKSDHKLSEIIEDIQKSLENDD